MSLRTSRVAKFNTSPWNTQHTSRLVGGSKLSIRFCPWGCHSQWAPVTTTRNQDWNQGFYFYGCSLWNPLLPAIVVVTESTIFTPSDHVLRDGRHPKPKTPNARTSATRMSVPLQVPSTTKNDLPTVSMRLIFLPFVPQRSCTHVEHSLLQPARHDSFLTMPRFTRPSGLRHPLAFYGSNQRMCLKEAQAVFFFYLGRPSFVRKSMLRNSTIQTCYRSLDCAPWN